MERYTDRKVNRVIKSLNEKYDDVFTCVSSGSEAWSANYTEFYFTSQNLDGALVNVRLQENGTIYDNYIEMKYKNEVEDVVAEFAEMIYGECQVINYPSSFGRGLLEADITFEEYITSEKAFVSTILFVNTSVENAERDIKALHEKLAANKVLTEITVYYFEVNNISEVELIDEKDLLFYPQAIKMIELVMDADYSVKKITGR